MLYLFEVDFHSTWLANSVADSQKPIFSGRKSTEFFKSFKTLLRKKETEIREVFLTGSVAIEDFMIEFYKLSRRFHLLEKKQEGPTSLEILLSCSTT